MPEIVTDRAQEVLVCLYDRMATNDPDGLYHDAAQAIEDLAEAWTAAREVISALRQKADAAARRRRSRRAA